MTRLLLLFLVCSGISLSAQNERFDVTPLGNDRLFDAPWDLEYGPDGYLWVTERKLGLVVRMNRETAARDVVLTIPDVYTDASQNGLLGMALHPDILGSNPYVYLSYTYQINDERRQRLVRYTYQVNPEGTDGTLTEPLTLIENLPASNDHNSGRLIYGPDDKLYYTIGDQGGNQGRNYCNPILSQVLPTQSEIDGADWSNYPGKVLRLNTDGSIPDDNPVLADVRSHVFTYGHRNAQGIVFGPDGKLYSDEHGPDTDDEVNLLLSGKNYGWPRVVGFRDDQAYDYCDWSTVANCADMDYDKFNCPDGATFLEENTLTDTNYQEPIAALFAVTDDYDFNDPACDDSWVCRPNVAPSSIAIYTSDTIPAWTNSLLVVSLKRGHIYRLQLDESGTAIVGDTTRFFYTGNRYRDLVVAPDGKTFYAITDVGGRVTAQDEISGSSRSFPNPGTILRFSLQSPVSVNRTAPPLAFRAWPNPADGAIRISTDHRHSADGTTATLFDGQGREVRRILLSSHQDAYLPTSDLPGGVYLLRLRAQDRVGVKRVVIR